MKAAEAAYEAENNRYSSDDGSSSDSVINGDDDSNDASSGDAPNDGKTANVLQINDFKSSHLDDK